MLIYVDSVQRRSYIFVFDDLQLNCAAVRARTTANRCRLHAALACGRGYAGATHITYLQERVNQPCNTVDELTDLLQQQLCMYPWSSTHVPAAAQQQ
jgi:hypothetical protein